MAMEVKVKGWCLRAVDYGEADRIITIITADNGKLAVKARGVRKPNAKLRYATAPMAFGEYILSVNNGFYSLISFDYIDSFSTVTDNLDSFFVAMIIAETADKLTDEFADTSAELTCGIGALMRLCYDDNVPPLLGLTYLSDILKVTGYGINVSTCPICGSKTKSYIFDMEAGGFVCPAHRGGLSVKLSENAANLLINTVENNQVVEAEDCTIKELYAILQQYIKVKTGKTIKSIFEFVSK